MIRLPFGSSRLVSANNRVSVAGPTERSRGTTVSDTLMTFPRLFLTGPW